MKRIQFIETGLTIATEYNLAQGTKIWSPVDRFADEIGNFLLDFKYNSGSYFFYWPLTIGSIYDLHISHNWIYTWDGFLLRKSLCIL